MVEQKMSLAFEDEMVKGGAVGEELHATVPAAE
jgi:hypothetical protein